MVRAARGADDARERVAAEPRGVVRAAYTSRARDGAAGAALLALVASAAAAITTAAIAATTVHASPRAQDAGPAAAGKSPAAADPSKPESGAVAPAGTWYTRGGCAARTGVTLTPPAGIVPREAWTYTAEGEIDSEPLVWEDRVVIEVVRGGDRRVEWIDLSTGARLAATEWIPGPPLAPCLWNGNIALRTGAAKLQVLAPREHALEPIFTFEPEGDVYAPLYVEDSIFVRVGDGIVRVDPPSTTPAWRLDGDFRSEIALRGERLWAVSYDKKGASWLWEIDRASGTGKKLVSCGQHQGQKPERGVDVQLGALAPQLFVYHALPITLADLTKLSIGMVEMGQDKPTFQTSYLAGQAVDCGVGWIAQIAYPDRGTCWTQDLGSAAEPPVSLASSAEHAELLDNDVPMSIAGGTALVGARAFDLATRELSWRGSRKLAKRPIPVRSGVLLTERGGKLVALLSERSVVRASALGPTAATPPALEIPAARALLRDGSVLSGKLKHAADASDVDLVSGGGVKSKFAVAQCLLIEQADGVLVWCADPPRYSEHARAILQRSQGKAWADLARDSLGTKDPATIERYTKLARAYGGNEADLAKVDKALGELVAKPQRVNKARMTELAEREAELIAAPAQGLLERARKLPAGVSPALRAALIAESLEISPDSAHAKKALEELVPAAKASAAGWSTAEWLDLAVAAQSCGVRPIVAGSSAEPSSAALARIVDAAAQAWKREVKAFGDERLLVIAAEPRYDAVARVLRWADLVCTALESMYGQPIAAHDDAAPLSIWLHPDKASYDALVSAQAPDVKRQPETAQAWFDSERAAVHVYLPSDPPLAAHTRSALAHALTHQWLQTRVQGVKRAPKLDDAQAGWWLAAGMATFMEELGFDERRREFGVQTGCAPSFDVVGQLKKEDMLAWGELCSWSRARTQRLDGRGTQVIQLRQRLGPKVLLSQLQLYYLQSAALVHYLWSVEDGRHRATLLKCVADWHSAEKAPIDTKQLFGLTSDELGKRAAEWMRERSASDVP